MLLRVKPKPVRPKPTEKLDGIPYGDNAIGDGIKKGDIEKCIDTAEYGRVLAVDTETTGLNPYGSFDERGQYPDRPFYISFTNADGVCDSIRFAVDNFTREVLYESNREGFAKAKRILEDETISKIFHNAAFDIIMLKFAGIEVKGKIFDTLVMAHVEDSGRFSYGLKPLTKALLNIDDSDQKELKNSVIKARRVGKKKGWILSEDVEGDYAIGDVNFCDKYGCLDTYRTMNLYWIYEDLYKNDEAYRKVVDKEMHLQKVLIAMQLKGISISEENALKAKLYYDNIITAQLQEKKKLGYGSLNTNSPKQMKEAFYERMHEEVILNKKTKKPTTDSKALQTFAKRGNTLADVILRIKAADHELKQFILPLRERSYGKDNAVHPNYVQSGPITGRLSCKNPNLMNISSNSSNGKKTEVDYKARECFVPREGHVLYFPDYSQIEMWLAMFISKDEFGMNALLNGTDMHTMLAKRVWGMRHDFRENFPTYRKKAKIAGFLMIYGGGPGALTDIVGCSFDEAKTIIDTYLTMYPGIAAYMDHLADLINNQGFIQNPFGRKYQVDSDQSYKAFNYMIQGTAADVMKGALINTHEMLNKKWKGSNILLNIHDEQCIEVPLKYHSKQIMSDIVTAMQGDFHEVIGIPKPLGVGMKYTTTNWAEVKELDDNFRLIKE